jgi:hypothetical protein
MRSGGAPRCIMCGDEREGLGVKEDLVIKAIRQFKRKVTKNEKGFRLVVCRDCYAKYDKLRSKYERRQMTYVALGLVLTITLAIVSQSVVALLYGLALTLLLCLLSLVGYVPALNMPVAKSDRAQGLTTAPKRR